MKYKAGNYDVAVIGAAEHTSAQQQQEPVNQYGGNHIAHADGKASCIGNAACRADCGQHKACKGHKDNQHDHNE